MVLKQRFADGRTNYMDIGDSWLLIEQNESTFEMIADRYFKDEEMKKGCISFVCFGRTEEPIYSNYPQWIYSNNGELFMNLTN